MKKQWLLPILVAFGLYACDNEVDLIAEYKDITIVYGFLDQTQDTQWVRVQKAFLGKGNALLFAMEPDSNFYGENQVDIIMRKLNTNNEVVDSTLLPKTEFHKPRNEGIFLSAPNFLYPYSQPIDQNFRYELIVRNKNSGKVTRGFTRIARKPLISNPPNSNAIINFEQNAGLPGANPIYSFEWLRSDNVVAYQFSLIFNYEEFPTANPAQITQKSFATLSSVFNPFIDEPTANNVRYPFSKRDFYNAVVANIQEDPARSRRFRNLGIKVYGATQDFYDYYEINRPSPSIVQKTIDFTNVDNGLGLYTSRVSVGLNGIRLHPNTIDSLRAGQFTNRLNFVD
jgi:hypothetical protein